jgi:hypothetical protein
MVFPVVGGDGKPTGYEVENSLRFDNPDDPNLSTTFSSAGNRRTFTISAWIKKGDTSADRTLIGQGGTSTGNPRGLIFVGSTLRFTNNTSGSSTDTDVETNAKLRDHSAWYHVVAAVDTTQGTAANRIKLYINGEQQTSLATATYPDQNFEMNWNNNVLHTVGRYPNNDAYHMDGHISEFYFIDGTQYAASNFGETDDNGVWIPKDASGDLTFGTNGFYLEFKQTGTGTNSSGMGADTSGNDNHLAVNNLAALDVTVDTPTNNFCTLNPISFPSGLVTHLRDGNLELLTTDSEYGAVPATFALTNGKWYWEIKVNASSDYDRIGLVGTEVPITTSFDFGAANLGGGAKTNLSYKSNDGKTRKDGTDANYGNTYTSGDIIGVAYNADDGDIYFYKNGTVQNSGTAAYTNLDGLTLMPAVGDGVGNAAGQYFCNFGNPTFSISSGNADANGYGNFEYAPPSGYYALCTKNLAEFG